MIKKWTKEEEQIVINNYDKPIRVLLGLLDRNRSSIDGRLRRLRNLGVIPQKNRSYPYVYEKFGNKKINLVKKYFPRYGISYCLDNFAELNKHDVVHIITELGLKRKIPNKKMHRFVNLEKLKQFCPLSCYILGFIWGDGHVNKNMVSVNNEKIDLAGILPYFLEFGNFYFRERKRDGFKDQLDICTNDQNFIKFLIDNGYLQKKCESADTILSILPENNKHFWWRGFFDADGHIEFLENRKGFMTKHQLTITSSYEQNWNFVEQLFKKLNIVEYSIDRRINQCGKTSTIISTQRGESFKFLDYIYKDYKFIGFGRKYMKYLQLKDHLKYREENPYFFKKERKSSIAKETNINEEDTISLDQ